MTEDEKYMQRALQLAENGRGKVSPNPMVGCVIVHNGNIIGEGYHAKYGEAHAEVSAVNSVKNQNFLSQSTVYVTLEPCSHFGKTPPCADLLIAKKVKRVVAAIADPNPKVAGSGLGKIREAGIETEVGICELESSRLNRRFFTNQNKKRPYIILKWAESEDGFIARENFESKWISSEWSRQLVHKWRTEEDAILVGKNSVLYDNPELTARNWKGKNPIRIMIDPDLNIPNHFHLFDQQSKSLIYNTKMDKVVGDNEWIKIERINLESELLHDLYSRNISSVIIEGGSYTLQNFINKNFWDEARVFKSSTKFTRGIRAPILNTISDLTQNIMNDKLTIYYNG